MKGMPVAKRAGNARTREQEFQSIVQAVRKDKAAFIRRLQRLVAVDGPCIRFLGARTKDGYGRVTMSYFRYMPGKRKLQRKKMSVYAHRLFLVLMLGRAIKLRHDAGHELGCPHRDCVRHVFEQPMSENCATAVQTAVSF